MKSNPTAAVALAGALLLLTGCSSILGGTHQASSRSWKSNFLDDTKTFQEELTVEPGMALHTVDIRNLNLSAGNIHITLLAPDGAVAWEETFTAPASFHRTLRPDFIPGTWTLKIELSTATGSYDIVWRAANEP